MRPVLTAAVLCTIAIIVSLPVVYALTPRTDFSDNVGTYRFFSGTRVCGDHLCKPGEWNTWVSNMFFSQIKKFSDAFGIRSISSTGYVKNASYNPDNSAGTAVNGEITRISTFSMDGGRYTSFISVTNNDVTSANHIVILQQSPDVKTVKAWISPQWDSGISLYKSVFDTSKASLGPGDTLNIVIVTDGKPEFGLDSLALR